MKVLIVDEGFIGSLHTALGLRAAGLEVVLLGAVGSDRSCETPSLRALTGPVPSDDRFLPAVRRIARAHACDVIVPVTEPTMLLLHGAASTLPAPLYPPIEGDVLRLVADKAALAERAAACGVLIPVQIRIDRRSGLRAALNRVGLPAVVKATRGRGGAGTHIVRSEAEADRAVTALMREGKPWFVQEWIAGTTYLVGGVFDRGRPVRIYAGEKVEQQPPLTGPASVIRSVHCDALVNAAVTAFAALRWTGLASADFVRSANGCFHFLEINPRPWGSIAAAADAGVDMFTPLAQLMAGSLPAIDLTYAADVNTRVLPLYLLNQRRWLDARTPLHIVRDMRSTQGAPFRGLALAVHVLHRLLRVRANWVSGAETRGGRHTIECRQL